MSLGLRSLRFETVNVTGEPSLPPELVTVAVGATSVDGDGLRAEARTCRRVGDLRGDLVGPRRGEGVRRRQRAVAFRPG